MVKGGKIQAFLLFVLLFFSFIFLGCNRFTDSGSKKYQKDIDEIIEKVSSDFESLSKDFSLLDGTRESSNKLLTKFKLAREDLIDARNELKEIKPPEDEKAFHNDFLDLLDDGTRIYSELSGIAEYIIKSNLAIENHLEDSEAFKMAYGNAVNTEQKVTVVKSFSDETKYTVEKLENLKGPKKFSELKKERISFFKELINVSEKQEKLLKKNKDTEADKIILELDSKLRIDKVIEDNADIINNMKDRIEELISNWEVLNKE